MNGDPRVRMEKWVPRGAGQKSPLITEAVSKSGQAEPSCWGRDHKELGGKKAKEGRIPAQVELGVKVFMIWSLLYLLRSSLNWILSFFLCVW